MYNYQLKKLSILIFILFIFQSCQTVEVTQQITFDNEQFNKITFLCNEIEKIDNYQPTYNKPYLDHLIKNSPSNRLMSWLNNNIIGIGTGHKLTILIENASIQTSEILISEKIVGIFKKPNETKYDLNYEVSFFIYNDANQLVGKTNVKLNRSTTSATRISLAERDQILEDLIYNSLKEFTLKIEENTKKYIKQYIL